MTKLDKNINLYSLITRTICCLFIYIPLTVALFFTYTKINIKSLKIVLIIIITIFLIIILIYNFITVFLVRKYYNYEVDVNSIIINRGVIFRNESIIPIKNIQHLTISKNPIQRLFKQSTLSIFTAGLNQSICGLNEEVASELMNIIQASLDEYLDEVLINDKEKSN